MAIYAEHIQWAPVPTPDIEIPSELPQIPRQVYEDRFNRVVEAMAERGLDVLVVYADREHFANFQYLTSIEPRFEEALLVVKPGERPVVMLGNENLVLADYATVPLTAHLYQEFSLPNQPRDRHQSLEDLLRESGVEKGSRVGLVGWKLFETEEGAAQDRCFDVPAFILEATIRAAGDPDRVVNANAIFVSPDHGVRMVAEASQIAVMEYGASLASAGVQAVVRHLRVGISELELGSYLNAHGTPLSCHPMVSTGEKAFWAMSSPSSRAVALGDEFTTAFGVWGGLTCRTGYAAERPEDLQPAVADYLDKIVRPYFAAVATWYETVGIGVTGGAIYAAVQKVLPKEEFGWQWNPGHSTAMDEWVASPIDDGSTIALQSGQPFQMDIIPFPDKPYYGSNVEDGIVLADAALRSEIEKDYPEVWRRMQERRTFMHEHLGLNLKPEVLPMSNAAGLLRPLMLNKEMGMVVKR